MVNYGYVPPDGYGMAPENSSNGNGANGHQRPPANGDAWNCTEGQKGLIVRVVHEHKLDKNEVEEMAHQLFGCGVTSMDKMQASQLIEDLLEKVGRNPLANAGGVTVRRCGNDRDHRAHRIRAIARAQSG